MTQISNVNVTATSTKAANEVKDVKDVKTAEVQSAEAKQLEEAKTKEDANVAVEIAEPEQKEEISPLTQNDITFDSMDDVYQDEYEGEDNGDFQDNLGFDIF